MLQKGENCIFVTRLKRASGRDLSSLKKNIEETCTHFAKFFKCPKLLYICRSIKPASRSIYKYPNNI